MKLAFDTGGTFTDFAMTEDDGTILLHKVLSTPDAPARAVLQGVDELLAKVRAKNVGKASNNAALQILGATTVVTNAVLKDNGSAINTSMYSVDASGVIVFTDVTALTGPVTADYTEAAAREVGVFKTSAPEVWVRLDGLNTATSVTRSGQSDFERTIVSPAAPFDRWLAGDKAAIPASAKRGFALFNGKADCVKCHSGWRFTDDSFHDIGALGADVGRATLLPGLESMDHAFKTPTLRDVARRAPYMHDGSEGTLEQVIELYDKGGRVRRPGLATEVHPLKLTAQDKRDLIDFMLTLSSPAQPVVVPSLPR